MRWNLLAAAFASTLFQFSTPSFGQAKLPDFLDEPHTAYADSVLATLTLREQIAQLLMPPIYAHATRENWDEMERWVETHQLGGVIAMQGAPRPTRSDCVDCKTALRFHYWYPLMPSGAWACASIQRVRGRAP